MAKPEPSPPHPLLRQLIGLAPFFQGLVPVDVGVTVTDRQSQLFYLPGSAGRLNIEPGDLVLPDSVSMSCMQEDRLVVKKMEQRLGHDYVGRAVPIKDGRGRVIGSFGTVELVTHRSLLEGMVIGKSPSFLTSYHQALKAARFDASVMVLGETGTGKELFARLIVEESQRREKPFIAVNCASIPPTLFESEMFGYDPGSFTGANKGGKQGYFELAQNGTIFLDEIGDLELGLQGKLLRVLETGRVSRVGGQKEIKVSARIITATNQDLRTLVRKKKFRADLFFRLSSIIIALPPLRSRRIDIRLYIDSLFEREKAKLNRANLKLSADAYSLLEQYDYPGNVRELENILRGAIILCEGEAISRVDVAAQMLRDYEVSPIAGTNLSDENEATATQYKNGPEGRSQSAPSGRVEENFNLEALQKMAIAHALAREPSKTKAARLLGISRDTLYRKIKIYGLA